MHWIESIHILKCLSTIADILGLYLQMVASFEELPLQDMEQWAMDAEESLGSRA